MRVMNQHITIDRSKYLHIGKWQNPDNDIEDTIYFYYNANKSYKLDSKFGFQKMKIYSQIGVYGHHPFVKGDLITLQDGKTQLRISSIDEEVLQKINPRLIQILEPRVIEQILSLE